MEGQSKTNELRSFFEGKINEKYGEKIDDFINKTTSVVGNISGKYVVSWYGGGRYEEIEFRNTEEFFQKASEYFAKGCGVMLQQMGLFEPIFIGYDPVREAFKLEDYTDLDIRSHIHDPMDKIKFSDDEEKKYIDNRENDRQLAAFLAGDELLHDYYSTEFENDDARKKFVKDINFDDRIEEVLASEAFGKFKKEFLLSGNHAAFLTSPANPERFRSIRNETREKDNEAYRWFAGLKKELADKGFDLADPMTAVMLRSFDYKLNDKNELLSFKVEIPTEITEVDGFSVVKAKDPTAISEVDGFSVVSDTNPLPNLREKVNPFIARDTNPLDNYRKNVIPLNSLNADEVKKLYDAAKEGKLFYYDKEVDRNTGKHFCYVKTDGLFGSGLPEEANIIERDIPEPQSNNEVEHKKENDERIKKAEETFPGAADPIGLFNNASYQRILEIYQLSRESRNNMALVDASFESQLLSDYYRHPDYYKDDKMAAYRIQVIYWSAFNSYDKQQYSDADLREPLHTAAGIDREDKLFEEIQKAFGLDEIPTLDDINEMAKAGCFTHADGTVIKADEDNPLAVLTEMTTILSKMDTSDRIVVYDKSFTDHEGKNNRICAFVSSTNDGGMAVDRSLTMGNRYDIFPPKNLENAGVTDELYNFLQSMPEVFREVGLDPANPADLMRFRILGNNEEGVLGRLAFGTLKQDEHREGVVSFTGEYEVDNVFSQNTDSVQRDFARVNKSSFAGTFTMTKERIERLPHADIHQLYMIMEAAKHEKLCVIPANGDVKSLKPIGVDKTTGKATVKPSAEELKERKAEELKKPKEELTRSEIYGSNAHDRATYIIYEDAARQAGEDEQKYIDAMNEAHKNYGIGYIMKDPRLSDMRSRLGEAMIRTSNANLSRKEFVELVKPSISEENRNPGEAINGLLKKAKKGKYNFANVKKGLVDTRRVRHEMAADILSCSVYDEYTMGRSYRNAFSDKISEEFQGRLIRDGLIVNQDNLPTEEQCAFIKDNDLGRLIFEPNVDNEAVYKNIVTAVKFTGSNLNRNDAGYAERLQLQQAEIVNERLRQIIASVNSIDINNIDDSTVVNKYSELHSYKMFFENKEAILTALSSNPYCNLGLMRTVNDIAKDFAYIASTMEKKLSIIANDAYPTFNYAELDNPAMKARVKEMAEALKLADGGTDLSAEKDLIANLEKLTNSKSEKLALDLHKRYVQDAGVNARDVFYLDSTGKLCPKNELAERMARGDKIFVADAYIGNIVTGYTADKNGTLHPVNLSEQPRHSEDTTFEQFLQGCVSRERSEYERLGIFIDDATKTDQGFHRSTGDNIEKEISELLRSGNYDDQKVKEITAKYYEHLNVTPTHFSKEELLHRVGLENIDFDNNLSEEQTEERRHLSSRAIQQTVNLAKMRHFSEPDRDARDKLYAGLSSIHASDPSRIAFFLKNNSNAPGTKESNNKFMTEFGDKCSTNPQEAANMLVARIEDKLAQIDKYFGKSYTDREVVDKYPEMFFATHEFSMHWEKIRGLIDSLKKAGATFNQEDIKRFEFYHQKAYDVSNYFVHRIENILNPYYRYGIEFELGKQLYNNPNLSANAERTYDKDLSDFVNNSMTPVLGASEMARHQLMHTLGVYSKLTAIVDGDGKFYDPTKSEAEIEAAVKSGKELYIWHEGSDIPDTVKVTDPSKLPPVTEKTDTAEKLTGYEIAEKNIQRDTGIINSDNSLSEAKRAAQKKLAAERLNVASVLSGSNPNELELTNALLRMLAVNTILPQVDMMPNDGDLGTLLSEDNINNVIDSLKKDEVVRGVAEQTSKDIIRDITDNPGKKRSLVSDYMYKSLDTMQAAIKERKYLIDQRENRDKYIADELTRAAYIAIASAIIEQSNIDKTKKDEVVKATTETAKNLKKSNEYKSAIEKFVNDNKIKVKGVTARDRGNEIKELAEEGAAGIRQEADNLIYRNAESELKTAIFGALADRMVTEMFGDRLSEQEKTAVKNDYIKMFSENKTFSDAVNEYVTGKQKEIVTAVFNSNPHTEQIRQLAEGYSEEIRSIVNSKVEAENYQKQRDADIFTLLRADASRFFAMQSELDSIDNIKGRLNLKNVNSKQEEFIKSKVVNAAVNSFINANKAEIDAKVNGKTKQECIEQLKEFSQRSREYVRDYVEIREALLNGVAEKLVNTYSVNVKGDAKADLLNGYINSIRETENIMTAIEEAAKENEANVIGKIDYKKSKNERVKDIMERMPGVVDKITERAKEITEVKIITNELKEAVYEALADAFIIEMYGNSVTDENDKAALRKEYVDSFRSNPDFTVAVDSFIKDSKKDIAELAKKDVIARPEAIRKFAADNQKSVRDNVDKLIAQRSNKKAGEARNNNGEEKNNVRQGGGMGGINK